MITLLIQIDDDITDELTEDKLISYIENAIASGVDTHPGDPCRAGLAAEVISVDWD